MYEPSLCLTLSLTRAARQARNLFAAAACLLALTGFTETAEAVRGDTLSDKEKRVLKNNFAPCLSKLKGPYTQNFCVCRDGTKAPVMGPDGKIRSPCGSNAQFCAAYRAPWAEALAQQGMYIGNIFSRDLYYWDDFADQHDLVRGYIIEKFFVETNPKHKLAQLRAYGGLSGAEYEAAAAPRFFERYLVLPSFNPSRHFLLAYELQKRFFVRGDQGQIHKVRAMATAVQARDPKFKPLRDATHNQISASLIPKLTAYRDQLPEGETRRQIDEMIVEITKLTSLGEGALKDQVAEIQNEALRARLAALVPAESADAVDAISSLAELMMLARKTVAAGEVSPGDARRLIDLDITAGAVIQSRGTELLDSGEPLPAKEYITLLIALTNASYGVGLLTDREREAAVATLRSLLATPTHDRAGFAITLKKGERIVEWAQNGALLAFMEVLEPWTFLLPQTSMISDDILRSSPLLLYARVSRKLNDYASGTDPIRHEIFGTQVDSDVRALNPGLSVGTLRVSPEEGSYSRDEVVALPETPTELQPAAGILTQGEGNVVSHVQLLARALGIPNVVVGSESFQKIAAHDGQEVFFLVTPGGRVYLKEVAAMSDQDRAIYDEYNKNAERTSDGNLGAGAQKLHIDRERIDVRTTVLQDLSSVRRSDSGIRSGPKAAYLGELKHLFPDKVARGVVVPFGAYYDHYQRATVAVPSELKKHGIAKAGAPLPDFVEQTYSKFFGEMIPAATSEKELSAWINPRLAIIQHSIRQAPLADELKTGIREELDRQGLLLSEDKSQTVGCFVRSDTNVEDLDNFNGAGLNLTLFNLRSLDDIYQGVKEVWASPFSFRSFSWRQTLIDEPLWVLPSVVILESVPSEKSGVLVTADIDHGLPGKMLVATSEGVGGAVDGTPAETLLWSPEGVELVTMFKSPWRRLLQPGGGSKLVPATGKEYVLDDAELAQLISTAQTINEKLEPAVDASGRARPWDIEFGFAGGKLWLFQVRPFVGNDELKNVPALAALEGNGTGADTELSIQEVIP